ncbi:MAG: glycosyltransferase family 39 protein [Thermoleophilaceae bacterium]|nr:glycosyltransferase family 39 protein [Thermoleophilaceae bacterium]
MSAVAYRRRLPETIGAVPASAVWSAAGMLGLIAVSLLLRTSALRGGFWIDEGLSAGIASHDLLDIPGVLRQDGSPPLYYMLLKGWTAVFDATEIKSHYLSLGFGIATIPAAWWSARSVFGERAGWFAAAFAAANPFLTQFSQEARMYALIILLGTLATGFFLNAYALRRRAFIAPFAVTLAALLYTHNWSLFFGAASVLAVVALYLGTPAEERRSFRKDALLGFGGVALLFLPWLPTLIFQAAHTGAPWSDLPPWDGPVQALRTLLGGTTDAFVALLAGGAGLAALFTARRSPERRATIALITLALGTLVIAWAASWYSPAWAARYFSIGLGPLLIVLGAGLSRSGRMGIAGTALLLIFWVSAPAPGIKSNAREVVAQAAPWTFPGDYVISTHPEQVPVIDYYMRDGVRYFTPLGEVLDSTVMDWRDAMPRLREARTGTKLEPLLDTLPRGKHLILVRPIIGSSDGWDAPWTQMVRRRSAQWASVIEADPRFTRTVRLPRVGVTRRGIRALVYRKSTN